MCVIQYGPCRSVQPGSWGPIIQVAKGPHILEVHFGRVSMNDTRRKINRRSTNVRRNTERDFRFYREGRRGPPIINPPVFECLTRTAKGEARRGGRGPGRGEGIRRGSQPFIVEFGFIFEIGGVFVGPKRPKLSKSAPNQHQKKPHRHRPPKALGRPATVFYVGSMGCILTEK